MHRALGACQLSVALERRPSLHQDPTPAKIKADAGHFFRWDPPCVTRLPQAPCELVNDPRFKKPSIHSVSERAGEVRPVFHTIRFLSFTYMEVSIYFHEYHKLPAASTRLTLTLTQTLTLS